MDRTERRPWSLTVAVLIAAVFGAGVVFAAPNVPTPRARPAVKPAAAAAAATHVVAVPLPRKRPHIAQSAPAPRFEAIAKTAPTSNTDPIALLTQGTPIAEVAALP